MLRYFVKGKKNASNVILHLFPLSFILHYIQYTPSIVVSNMWLMKKGYKCVSMVCIRGNTSIIVNVHMIV